MNRLLGSATTALMLLLAGAWVGPACSQQTYPNRPIRVIVPYAPGGATDIIARYLAAKLNELWGTPLIVDNRSGASGNIALEAAAKATPDGYTLFVGNVTTNAINETTFAGVLNVRPSRDLIGITSLIEIPHGLLAYPGFAPATVRQFVDYAKANPKKVNYTSAGIGSYPHLDMLVFMRAASFEATHVPYKSGAAGMITGLISGEVHVGFTNLASTIEHVRAGRIRALAVTMPNRIPELPNVPTMAEQGYPGVGTNAWQGVFAPAGVPAPVLDKIYKSVVQVMDRPEMKEQLGKQMMTVSLSKAPADYTGFVKAQTQKWADIVKENNVKIE